jgi:DNA polymerase
VDATVSDPPPSAGAAARGAALRELGEEAASCVRCRLAGGRKTVVFGDGNPDADLMFIGEAPGAEEDRRGLPFVGPAGELLTRIIGAIGLAREQVYIANILKCRPPKNRDPNPEEAAACEPYLNRQIALLAPKIIVAVGRIAGQTLLKTNTPIGKLRGRVYAYGPGGTPLLVTYHPAYLLRSPREKAKAWQDLVFAKRVYAEAQSGDSA